MHPNFIRFRQKISFKSALESFTSGCRHSRTALNTVAIPYKNHWLLESTVYKIRIPTKKIQYHNSLGCLRYKNQYSIGK